MLLLTLQQIAWLWCMLYYTLHCSITTTYHSLLWFLISRGWVCSTYPTTPTLALLLKVNFLIGVESLLRWIHKLLLLVIIVIISLWQADGSGIVVFVILCISLIMVVSVCLLLVLCCWSAEMGQITLQLKLLFIIYVHHHLYNIILIMANYIFYNF